MYSEYDELLLGDLAIVFSDAEIPEFRVWVIPVLLMVGVLLIALGFTKLERSGGKGFFKVRANLLFTPFLG
jgi:hypothetical protein